MGVPPAAVMAKGPIKRLFIDESHSTVREACEAWVAELNDDVIRRYATQILKREDTAPSPEAPWNFCANSIKELRRKIIIEGLMALLRTDPELAYLEPKYVE